jgi:hypothetical protein
MKNLIRCILLFCLMLAPLNGWATDTKISDLSPKTTPAAADIAVIVDSADGLNKKITLGTTAITNANSTTAADMFPLFSATQGGYYAALTNTSFKFNPNTGLLTAPGFSGPLTGAASSNVLISAATAIGDIYTVDSIIPTVPGKIAAVATGQVLISQGTTTKPIWSGTPSGLTSIGATTFTGALTGTASGNPSTAALAALTTGIVKNTNGTGALSIAVEGTDYQPIPVQIPYTSATPWTPAPAVGTAGAEIRWYCDSVDHALVFGTPTGTPVNGQTLIITMVSDASARALDFTTCTAFTPVGVVLPITTVASKITTLGCKYHSGRGKYLVYAVSQEQ